MSLLKSEAKLYAINELGARLDDALENATKGLYREEGAADTLRQALISFDQLLKVFDRELADKNVDIESTKILKEYFIRCRSFLVNLATTAETNKQACAGKISAFQQSVNIAKKFKDEEVGKLQVMRNAIEANMSQDDSSEEKDGEESVGEVRRIGQRPQTSIKIQRLAEEMKNSLATKGEETAPVEEKQVSAKSETKPKKQKK